MTENAVLTDNTNTHESVDADALTLNNVALQYDDSVVVEHISFALKQGEIGCILGPSGSGKTSILRAIAGFMPITSGSIDIHQQRVSSKENNLAPGQRGVGLVFQDFALFPHMTVAENVAFGLHDLDKQTQKQRVEEYLHITGITAFANVYPAELSGGQQQRVAIARAIAPQPKLLLMDEAFSSLDPALREQLAHDVRSIIKKQNLTALLVTHDQTEAFTFADNIAVVANQRLQQFSSAYHLYHQPQTYFVANFIGEGVFINGVVLCDENHCKVATALGEHIVKPNDSILPNSSSDNNGFAHQQSVRVLMRPDDIIHDDDSDVKAIIEDKHFRGAFIRYQLKLAKTNERLLCFAPSHHNHNIGEAFGIRTNIEHVICFA
ncbi:MAG: ABC transporter ATP-binding protein [Glaciecola sp.]